MAVFGRLDEPQRSEVKAGRCFSDLRRAQSPWAAAASTRPTAAR